MAKLLIKMNAENYVKQEQVYLIKIPAISERILIKFRDKKSQIQTSIYSFIDKTTGHAGVKFFWNNYKNCVEKMNVSLTADRKFLIELPKHFELEEIFC